MKKIWLLITCICAIFSTSSIYSYKNYYDEFLLQQKAYLAAAGLTDAPPTGYIPFTIINNSGFSDSEVFVLVLANNFNNIITFERNSDGQMIGTSSTPPPKTYVSDPGSGVNPLSFFLTKGANTFYLPTTVNLTASRIYFSVGQPVDWFISASGPVQVPAKDFEDPTQDNFYTLFDKQEFTMVANDRFIINPTLVDYYGLPLSFSISFLDHTENPPVQTTSFGGLPPTLTSFQVFTNYINALTTLPTTPLGGTEPKWSALHLTYAPPSGGAGKNLRVLSPNQGIQTNSPAFPINPLFPIDYFLTNTFTQCDWLDETWKNAGNNAIYQTNSLFIDLSTSGPTFGVAKGDVDNSGVFKFVAISGEGTGSTLDLPLPTSSKAFFTSTLTDYTPAPTITGNSKVADAIWQALSAGVITGIIPLLGTSENAPLSQSFFRQNPLFVDNANLSCVGPWYDFYSGTFISLGSGNYTKFFTTPYGDFLGISGEVTVTNISTAKTNVTITLANMTGIPVPDPFNDTNDYTVTFNALPSDVVVTFGTNPNFSSNPTVSSSGQTFNTVPGADMYLGVTYTNGNFQGRVWGTHLIPSGPAPKPILPGGLTLSLSGGPGGTLTITIGAAP